MAKKEKNTHDITQPITCRLHY